ncbi:small GTP-binding protein domain [Allomyces macrogynus ATCC 38327]|uniref:Small GTP-binding protein domain n=1 Tax=Allomyces macrogynus (strain ATCC 38327) TaxID=578462 RepID=A0A0L0SSF2_ALLM3|nr:small GTP-binding protein domain [Allomyces macrogynus ATCC 38327]|eukprot:KNE65453.1 small GTP-binding protein domain [Allomyces macrogynus ATCC 38327]
MSDERKAVFIGDGATGKSALLMTHCEKRFPMEYVPTVFETHNINIAYRPDSSKQCALSLWDTAGQEEYDRLRPLSYPDANVIVICFKLAGATARHSYNSVMNKWWPEARHFCPKTPLVLVGTQCDVRDEYERMPEDQARALGDREMIVIDPEEGESMRRAIKAAMYIETSAKTMTPEELEGVFQKIASVAMGEDKSGVAQLLRKPAKHCIIM